MYNLYPIVRFTRLSVVLLFAGWLSGCASGLSKEECASVDWRALGYEDGVGGRTQARVAEHRKACAKHGVALDLDAYRSGWQAGVQHYCQPGSAYHQGRSGAQYLGVCPAVLEAAFLPAYRKGRELYLLEADVARLSRALANRHRRLADVEVEIRDTGLDLVAEGLSTDQRIVLLDELRKLEAEHSDIRNYTIPDLEGQLAAQQDKLARLKAAQRY